MPVEFRLLEEGAASAAWNMAEDAAILEAVIRGDALPTLRLYGWSETAVTVGRFQDVEKTVNLAYCAERRIPVVRRPTGGRGILHGGDITVSLILPESLLGEAGRSVASSYQLLSTCFERALARLGVAVAAGDCERAPAAGGDCFAWQSRADMVAEEGGKLVGSAQRRSDGVILQQSSLRWRPLDVTVAEVFHGVAAPERYPLAALPRESVVDALCRGFREAFGWSLNPGSLTEGEGLRAAEQTRGGEANERGLVDTRLPVCYTST
jgi:lipoate-protein ligase A